MFAGKVIVSMFWDAEGVLLEDHLDKGHTIIGAYYADLPRQEIRRGKLRRGVFFHRDTAPTHMSTVVMVAIQKCGFQLVEHSPYSPNSRK